MYEKMVLNYRFKVLLDNHTLSFARISGLGMEQETETISEGGHNQGGYIVAGVQKNPKTLRMESGVYNKGNPVFDKLKPGIYLRQGIVIMTLGKNGAVAAVYATGQAFVTKWEVADLDASQGKMLIHTFEIAYRQLKLQS